MTAVLLLGPGQPLLQQLFPPVPLIEQVHRTPMLIFGVLYFCLAVAYLALWRAASDFRVFRSMGILFAVLGAQQFFEYFGGIGAPVWSLRALAVAILVETAAEAMRIRNFRWTRLFWPVYLFAFFTGWYPSLAFVNDWPVVCSQAALAILIIQGFRHGNRRDRAIAAVFTAYFPMRMTISTAFTRITGIENYATIGGWRWQYTTCSLTLLGAATLAIFVRDLINDRREKQRMAAELAAGRAVQQVLIPEEILTVEGFNIQSVYKPYGEVGGDFFQVLPVKSDSGAGGVLVIIGDVSGKGMPAAMTVSLLVGTVRTLAHYTQSPGDILAAMNQRMLARSHGGFTTCLVLRADPDGKLTIANAGHIAPYLGGKELPLENGLPLGLAAETAYHESIFQVTQGQQITLLTDGVVEARDKSGALFGFDRTAAISTETAESIARAAQHFGQDDDITVLTLLRTA
ncbi:MAG: PP2C family protein-serine/threonine phosphatase [Terracidiphilus sp.]|nr:PP2C family protein-serine/threonine phosphatase [Terracidiphilus sp.]MDR3799221.1 PP2C family protein-serine/threonine phosphatase [Terracidiphilus sp.]